MNCILLGSNERAAYSLAKSLTKNNHTVDILNDKSHPLKYSRFIRSFFTIRSSFEKETEMAISEIVDFLKSNHYDVLIPVHDTALTICFNFKELISPYTKIAYVNKPEIHKFCSDKSTLLEICQRLEVPTPESILIKSLVDIGLLGNLKYPCIAKPVSSKVFTNGRIFSYTVKKVNSHEELIDFIREKIETVAIMVQEVLPAGFGAGYNFLAVNGKIIQAYAHARINEAWGGGQSTYRKTIPPDAYKLKDISEKITNDINWTGIAMLEFLIANDTPYVMEINGRAWGSIELGIFSGCDLPNDMLKVLFEKKPIDKYIYTAPHYSRNLLNEIIWILKSKSLKKFLSWLFSLKDDFQKNHLIEDSIFTDFKFRTGNIITVLFQTLKKGIYRIQKLFSFVHHKTLKNKSQLKFKQIAFICKGNINRSAFAEAYINMKYPGHNICSYGTVFEEKRLSPVNAILAAKKKGIDLNTHRSRYLSAAAISNSDIFIIMDKENFWDLRERKIKKEKIFWLNIKDIDDPYKHDLKFFQTTFDSIAVSIDSIFSNL